MSLFLYDVLQVFYGPSAAFRHPTHRAFLRGSQCTVQSINLLWRNHGNPWTASGSPSATIGKIKVIRKTIPKKTKQQIFCCFVFFDVFYFLNNCDSCSKISCLTAPSPPNMVAPDMFLLPRYSISSSVRF